MVAPELDNTPTMAVELADQSCKAVTPTEGKSCQVLVSEPNFGAWLYTFDKPQGYEKLWASADLPGGKVLSVVADNYVDGADGKKTVGPHWQPTGSLRRP